MKLPFCSWISQLVTFDDLVGDFYMSKTYYGSLFTIANLQSKFRGFKFGKSTNHEILYLPARHIALMGQIVLVMTNIAIENGPFVVDLPIKDGGFPASHV